MKYGCYECEKRCKIEVGEYDSLIPLECIYGGLVLWEIEDE